MTRENSYIRTTFSPGKVVKHQDRGPERLSPPQRSSKHDGTRPSATCFEQEALLLDDLQRCLPPLTIPCFHEHDPDVWEPLQECEMTSQGQDPCPVSQP